MSKNSIFAPKFPEYKSGIQEKTLKCFDVPSKSCTYYSNSDRWPSGIWTDDNSSSASYFSSTFFPPPLFLIVCLQLSFPLILGNNHLPSVPVTDEQVTELTLNITQLELHQLISKTWSYYTYNVLLTWVMLFRCTRKQAGIFRSRSWKGFALR